MTSPFNGRVCISVYLMKSLLMDIIDCPFCYRFTSNHIHGTFENLNLRARCVWCEANAASGIWLRHCQQYAELLTSQHKQNRLSDCFGFQMSANLQTQMFDISFALISVHERNEIYSGLVPSASGLFVY